MFDYRASATKLYILYLEFEHMEIVVVGCKGFGKVHLRSIKGLDVSIVETDKETIDFCKNNYDIRKVYSSLDEAIRSNAEIIDLVVPHTLHKELSIKAMRSKKNVLIEKPIATNLEDGRIMIREARSNHVKFMVAEQYYFDPAVRKAKELITDGAIGKIHTVIVRDQRFYSNTGWRTKKDKMGGGALIDGGIHYIETMLDFGGDYIKITGNSVHGGSTLEGEDTTHAIFEFKNGITGLFFYTWGYKHSPKVPGFEVIGENGSMYEDASGRSQEDFKSPARHTAYGDLIVNGKKIYLEKYDVFEKEISSFVEAVNNDLEVPYPPEKALKNLEAVLKIYGQ